MSFRAASALVMNFYDWLQHSQNGVAAQAYSASKFIMWAHHDVGYCAASESFAQLLLSLFAQSANLAAAENADKKLKRTELCEVNCTVSI